MKEGKRASDARSLYKNRRDVKNRQEYEEELAERIEKELENYGYCTLLDDILDKPRTMLYQVNDMCLLDTATASVLTSVYEKRTNIRVNLTPVQLEDRNFTGYMVRNYIRYDSLLTYLIRQIEKLGRERMVQRLNQLKNQSAVNHSVQDQLSKRLEEAHAKEQELAGQLKNVREDAARQRRESDEQLNKLLEQQKRDFEQRMDQLLEQQRRDFEQQLDQLLEQQRRDLEQKHGQALEEQQKRAEQELEHEKERLRQEAEERADQLVQRYLAREQKAFKDACNHEVQNYVQDNMAHMQSMGEVRDAMQLESNNCQSAWVRSVDEMLEQLRQQVVDAKQELYGHMDNWQRSLYRHELEPLANTYQQLYQILNVDRLIRAQILFEDRAEDPNAVAPEVLTGLERLNQNMTKFLRRFETALNNLDLYVYYPKEGEAFDPIWHIDMDDDDVAGRPDARVASCIVPGVAKQIKDDRGDDVVCCATVTVKYGGDAV